MSKKANPTAIGVFVVLALVIAVAGILVLGSGKMFEKATTYTLYFEGDLNGLDVGAPVTIKGVKVGEVVGISIVYDHSTETITTPVVIKIMQGSFVQVNQDPGAPKAQGEAMNLHIERGLRAQLETLSMVTGKLRISLDYHPDTELVYRSKNADELEIPTIPTSLENLVNRISNLPIEEILTDLRKSSASVAKFFESGQLDKTFVELNETLEGISAVVQSSDMQSVLKSLDETLKETQRAMKEVAAESKPLRRDLAVAIEEFSDAARAAQYLLEYLERHPEALLRGTGSDK
jgi:paraquat-inducible protein B